MDSSQNESLEDVVMDTPAGETKPAPQFRPFTKAERIQQLNDIDKGVTQLLQSAGLAIKTLTAYRTESNGVARREEEQPEAFIDATNAYLKCLHSVDVRLKRQIYGLNEAGIIKESSGGSDEQNQDGARVDKIALDIGWLNSRSSKVGRDMEAELWVKSRAFLEAMGKGGIGQTQESNHAESDQEIDIGDETTIRHVSMESSISS